MYKIIWSLLTLFCISLCFSTDANAQTKTIDTSTTILQDTIWEGLIIIDGVRVNIAQNVTLTVTPGTIVSGKNGALLYVMGKLKVIGEENKKIRFQPEHNEKPNSSLAFYIDSTSTSEIAMEHFILEGGGGNQDSASLPALTVRGKGSFSQGIIRRNLITGLRIWSSDVKIENNEIYENESISVENKSTTNNLKAENNWWGSEDGPTLTSIANSPRSTIKGLIDFDPWQEKGPIPIILLPGFGGSFSYKLFTEKAKDSWWLTPLGTSSYRYFVKALILNNYFHEKDFFWGFYDWRLSNKDSGKKYLEKIIDNAKEKSGHSQVHIVAHSMGGLVAQSYAERDEFRDDIDRLVTVGAPHLGSSEIYPAWEGGQLLDEKKPVYVYLWYLQALDWDWNKVEYIRKNFPSLGEMMPIYDYLEDNTNEQKIAYKNQKIKNPFLESLSDPDILEKLTRKISVGIVVGNGENTLEKISVSPYENDDKWEDGIPNPIDPPKDTMSGDGTVTVKSAKCDSKLTNNIFTIESNHTELLKNSTKTIFDFLRVKAKFPMLTDILNHFLLSAKGPASIEIKDHNGKLLNLSKQEIEDSHYFTQEIDKQILAYADFPFESSNERTLQIKFKGTGKDNLKAAFWNFSENSYQKQDFDIPVTKGLGINYNVVINENEIKASPYIPLKSLIVLVNRQYEVGKISNWDFRSQLINKLAEAYQDNSNGRAERAKDRITEATELVNSHEESETKKFLAESLKNLETRLE